MKRPGVRVLWAAVALFVVSVVLAVGAAACSAGAPATLAPAAFGEAGHCYFVDDPAEATTLISSGACPSSWTPAPMPLVWHQRYAAYYASPVYVNRYVPAPVRTVYVQQSKAFAAQYPAQITALAKTATWRSSTGKTVTGPVAATKFGGGSARAPSFGGGAGRAPAPAPAPATARASFGGGAARAPAYGGGAARAPVVAPARPAPPPAPARPAPAPAPARPAFGGGARGGR